MIYDANGNRLNSAYNANGIELNNAYDSDGNVIFTKTEPVPPSVDYSDYSFIQQWGSKGISPAQDFAVYDDKVFWVAKSGNDSVPADCYIFNLNTAEQIAKKTVYSGHGNSVTIDDMTLYASTGYSNDKVVYINALSNDFTATLIKTLIINDSAVAIDACIDEQDKDILWTHGKTATTAETDIISKWDLSDLTDNGDGTYSPRLIYSVNTPKPETIFAQESLYFQGCSYHDGMLWYPTWASGFVGRIVAVNPQSGEVEHIISTETTTEVEGAEFYPDANAVGGYAMYVGFASMMLRKYTFGALASN